MSNSSRNLLYVRRPWSFKDCRATGKKNHYIIEKETVIDCRKILKYWKRNHI
jgi:hypothetical protein